MKRRANGIEQWAVRILCALSFAFVGFAHQLPALAQSSSNFSAYVLPDGTLPTLCVTVIDDSGKSHGKIAHMQGCEACRIGASVVLPAPGDLVGANLGFAVAAELPRRAEVFHHHLYPPNSGPRAPPVNPILA